MNGYRALARAEPLDYLPESTEACICVLVLVFTMAANVPESPVSGNTFQSSRPYVDSDEGAYVSKLQRMKQSQSTMGDISFGVTADAENVWLLIVLSPGVIGFLAPMIELASFSALSLQRRTLTDSRCFTDRPSNANLAGLTS